MNDTVTISKKTNEQLNRVLSRIEVKLRREDLTSSVSEEFLMQFMGYQTKVSVTNAIKDGRIPQDAFITLTNGKRRYFLDKLIKRE